MKEREASGLLCNGISSFFLTCELPIYRACFWKNIRCVFGIEIMFQFFRLSCSFFRAYELPRLPRLVAFAVFHGVFWVTFPNWLRRTVTFNCMFHFVTFSSQILFLRVLCFVARAFLPYVDSTNVKFNLDENQSWKANNRLNYRWKTPMLVIGRVFVFSINPFLETFRLTHWLEICDILAPSRSKLDKNLLTLG